MPSSHPACRLLLYCDHPILAFGLQSILAAEGDFVFEQAKAKEEVLALMQDSQPDMLLIDMTSDFNLGFLQEIRRTGTNCKIILWIDAISTETAYQAFSLGVRGILQKMLSPDLFLTHLRSIQEGNLWVEKGLMNSIASAKTVSLTRREAQLVSLLAQALKNKEIAATLNVTENTVKAYLSRLFQKLGVKDRLELALYGLKNLNGNQNWAQADHGTFHFNDAGMGGKRSFQSILMQSQVKTDAFSPRENVNRF